MSCDECIDCFSCDYALFSDNLQDFMASRDMLFSHYTSAENACKIISSRRFWLRNVQFMNDYSEVSFGFEMILKIINNINDQWKRILQQISDEAPNAIKEKLDSMRRDAIKDTYIGCISEHGEDENECGRLSMWRAYGGKSAGVSIVINMQDSGEGNAGLIISRAEYLSEADAQNKILSLLEKIDGCIRRCGVVNADSLISSISYKLLLFCLTWKHPAFREEREWRLISNPIFAKNTESVKERIVEIGGVPQKIKEVPLENNPDVGVTGSSLSELLRKIIIGPSQYPEHIRDVFVQILRENNISSPDTRVVISGIPLRL